ncbi:MAG: response regulator [Actinomycetota bacterium]
MIKQNRAPAIGRPVPMDFSHFRVLVLDPFLQTRRLLADILTRDMRVGEVRTTAALGDALEVVAANGANILFCDWSDELNALDLLRFLRSEDSPDRFLPVVVTTGFNNYDRFQAALAAGATEFMLKPFTAQAVENRLKSAARPRPFVQASGFFGPDRRRSTREFPGLDRRNPFRR